MKIGSHFVIRCGTPDCDWGFPMFSAFDERELGQCRKAFRQYCIERHHLAEDDLEALALLNIAKGVSTNKERERMLAPSRSVRPHFQ